MATVFSSPSLSTTSLSKTDFLTMIRRGGPQDVPFLRSLLAHAYGFHVNVLETDIPVGRYVDGWGRKGDTGLVWMDGGHRVGAAWYRLFRPSTPGYGFVDDQTPELTVAVVPSRQGQGIGQELLRELVDRARAEGYAALSVSVQRDNPELETYAGEGFEQVGEQGSAVTMLRRL
jgi:GNAT superfamily N-acetyltransferase